MKPFIFSADSHVSEPSDLYQAGLPASLKKHALATRRDGDFLLAGTEEKTIYRMRLGNHRESPLAKDRAGLRDINGRLGDMEYEGIDAEICFPTLGLWLYAIGDADAEAASARLYNDWHIEFLGGHPDRFVQCGMLPVLDFSNTLAELDYLASRGVRSAMLPAVTPTGCAKYNDPVWDVVFARAAQLGIVFVMHTGTGLESVTAERGPGAAIINYTGQAMDAQNTAMYLIAGGVLDRNPGAKVAFIEAGASWLVALGERMDEVAEAHEVFVRPKLSRRPSQIIDEQVWAAFQHDRACVLAASGGLPGARNVMWGSDYPHAEGTWPVSRDLASTFLNDPTLDPQAVKDCLGLNAARLFGISPTVHTGEAAGALVN
ncbi:MULTISPECIES: amidohydrolase family protein [unclassified Sphingobium]|uniref:amidohydrolase family protein n=1 Tax=unclassified Sphingobium TaxID=2611147 RepID=UPI0035A6F058